MANLSTVLFGWAMLLVQSAVLSRIVPTLWMPYLLAGVIVYLALQSNRVPLVTGCMITFVLGYLHDITASCPPGLYTVACVSGYLVLRAVSLRVSLPTITSIAITSLFLGLWIGFMVIGLRGLFEPALPYAGASLLKLGLLVAVPAAVTAAVSPLVYEAMRSINLWRTT